MQKPIVLGGALLVTVGLQAPALAHIVRVEAAFKDVPGSARHVGYPGAWFWIGALPGGPCGGPHGGA